MPLYKELRWNQFQLAIWKIEPEEEPDFSIQELSEADQRRFAKIKNEKRSKEFLAARMALGHLMEDAPQLTYSEKGAPILPSHLGVSLSHNKDYAAAMLSESHRVGIDLEAYRPQMDQLKNRYCSLQELKAMGPEPSLAALAAHWAAKETMIKLLDAPQIDLRREITIAPFQVLRSAVSKALIKIDGQMKLYPLYFKMEADFCLCFSYD